MREDVAIRLGVAIDRLQEQRVRAWREIQNCEAEIAKLTVLRRSVYELDPPTIAALDAVLPSAAKVIPLREAG